MGLVDEQRHAATVGLFELLARLDGAVQELQQQLGDEDRVVLADGGLGAGDDQDLAALEDLVEVDRVGWRRSVSISRVEMSRSSLLRGGLSAWAAQPRSPTRAGNSLCQ